MAYDFATSLEFDTDYISSDYETFLDRAPGSGGLDGLLSAVDNGVTEEQVDPTVLGSQEYFDDVT